MKGREPVIGGGPVIGAHRGPAHAGGDAEHGDEGDVELAEGLGGVGPEEGGPQDRVCHSFNRVNLAWLPKKVVPRIASAPHARAHTQRPCVAAEGGGLASRLACGVSSVELSLPHNRRIIEVIIEEWHNYRIVA